MQKIAKFPCVNSRWNDLNRSFSEGEQHTIWIFLFGISHIQLIISHIKIFSK